MTRDAERLALAAFLTWAILAGGNAVCIRFSNRELDPLWGGALRFSLAALVLIAVMAAMRLELPRGRALAGALLYGALTFGAGFAFTYYGLVRIHAGLGQTVMALVPLVTLLLAVLQHQERLRRAAVAGALLALAGIALMSRPAAGETVPLLSLLAVLAAVFCFAQGAVLVRGFPQVHPVTGNAIGMTTGALLLLAGSLVAGETFALPERGATWTALAYLVGVGSVVVFVLYLVVLRFWSASRVAYGFVLVPLVTLPVSAWLDNEPVGLGLVAGGLLVLAGVYVGALRPAAATP
jgi:drug/metabolite transporter (DMT)-like permease